MFFSVLFSELNLQRLLRFVILFFRFKMFFVVRKFFKNPLKKSNDLLLSRIKQWPPGFLAERIFRKQSETVKQNTFRMQ